MMMQSDGDILTLAKKRVVLFDGAMGTMLIGEGLSGGEAPEMWNIQRPETVRSVHKRYFDAGSDVALTNTFGGNRLKLRRAKQEKAVFEINTAAVELARSASPPGRFVAGDIGPSGELLAPVGTVTPETMEDVFAEQADALASGGVDFILIETMFSLQEAVAALRGARRACNCPVVVSITYESKSRGFFTMMGETPETCVKTLQDEGADGVGTNCTLASGEMILLARVLRESTSLPLIVEPNAGKPFLRGGKTVYDQTPEEFARDIHSMVEAGVDMVGGCCGTTPEFISAVHRALFPK
ncbi:MAG: homocysteine S-methyltransferase family protein [Deltaproteobacteria bacterium]|nr:homocysteine S-methyltransferase family protein [Deltaproteobacteria bacterium]